MWYIYVLISLPSFLLYGLLRDYLLACFFDRSWDLTCVCVVLYFAIVWLFDDDDGGDNDIRLGKREGRLIRRINQRCYGLDFL